MHLSLASILAESARRFPHKTALVEGASRITYADLWRQARGQAAALIEQGIRPGDRAALLCSNIADFVRAYYGILAVGGAVVPVPTLLCAEEADYLLTHSKAKLLICEQSLLSVGRPAADSARLPVLPLRTPHAAEMLSLHALADELTPIASYVPRGPLDTAIVFYTSGTTGQPKGAVLTHLNLVMNATSNAFDANEFRNDDVVLGCLPLFHTFGQSVAMNATFRVGATLVLQPRFDPGAAIELMHTEGVTQFFGVPTMYMQLLDKADEYEPVTGLRTCISGGAPLPVSVIERFEKTFDTTIYEGYGLTETSPTATLSQVAFGTKPGSVGHPLWGVEVEIAEAAVEDRIELLPTGEAGEIVVRGHNVFAGYLDDPEATAQVMVDGWFRTGDIGVKDDDGFVSITDRKKDLIIRGGFNVYPREVEEVLARHPAIAQVAVIGLPHDTHGEEICAVVVPAPSESIDPDQLIAWANERLARHKYPRRVEVVDALPLGPSHKVLKRELRRQFSR